MNLTTPTGNVNPGRGEQETFATCDTLPSADAKPGAAVPHKSSLPATERLSLNHATPNIYNAGITATAFYWQKTVYDGRTNDDTLPPHGKVSHMTPADKLA